MSKAWQTFDRKIHDLKQINELVDSSVTLSQKQCTRKRNLNTIGLALNVNLQDYSELDVPNTKEEVRRLFTSCKRKINEQNIVNLYKIFSEFIRGILDEVFESNPNRVLSLLNNKNERNLSFQELLSVNSYSDIEHMMVLKVYRALENERSTGKLLKKVINVTNINIDQNLQKEALLYLEIRHLIIHNNSKADDKFKNMNANGLVHVNARNNKILVNYKVVSDAISKIQSLCQEMKNQLIAVNLIR